MSVRRSRMGYASPPLNPRTVEGRFETNGAANPTTTQLFGTIESVTRLTSTGGNAFYRVRMAISVGLPGLINRVHGSFTIEQDIDGGDDLAILVPSGYAMPSATPIQANEFDIVVTSAGVPTNSVATGRFVSFSLLFDDVGNDE